MILVSFLSRSKMCASFIVSTAAIGSMLASPDTAYAGGAEGEQRPNILFILADDYGVDKSELYTQQFGGYIQPSDYIPPTPALRSMADLGILYENMWSAPNCSPTRAHIHTGQYGFRTRITNVTIRANTSMAQLDTDNPYLLPKLLRNQGYLTGFVGKWQLNWPPFGGMPTYIQDAGYDYVRAGCYGSYGPDRTYAPLGSNGCKDLGPLRLKDSCADGIDYFFPTLDFRQFMDCNPGTHPEYPGCRFRVPELPNAPPLLEALAAEDYSTIVETRAAEWLMDKAEDEDKPWFINLSYHTPHPPYILPPREEVDPDLVLKIEAAIEAATDTPCVNHDCYVMGKRYLSSTDPKLDEYVDEDEDKLAMLTYAAMVSAMDTQIGVLLGRIDLENTYVIFAGDNGTPSTVVEPGFELISKSSYYQLGMNVPFIIAGPHIKNPGRRSKALASTTDVYSTILDMAGVAMKGNGRPKNKIVPNKYPIDGRSIAATFRHTKEDFSVRSTVYNEIEFLAGNPAYPRSNRGDGTSSYGGYDGETIRNKRYKLISATAFFDPDPVRDSPTFRFPGTKIGYAVYEAGGVYMNGTWACVEDPQPFPPPEDTIGCDKFDRVKVLEFYDLENDPLEEDNLFDNPSLSKEESRNLRSLLEKLAELTNE